MGRQSRWPRRDAVEAGTNIADRTTFGARDRAPAPRRAVGASAVELLLRRLRSGSALPVDHVGLLPELKVRTSCGAVPAG